MDGAFETNVDVEGEPYVTDTPLTQNALLDQDSGGKTKPIMGFTEQAYKNKAYRGHYYS
jgi:hypothetical protein